MMKTAGSIGMGSVQTVVVASGSTRSHVFVQGREYGRFAVVVATVKRVVHRMCSFSAHASSTAITRADNALQSGCFAAFARCSDDAINHRSAVVGQPSSSARQRPTRGFQAVFHDLRRPRQKTLEKRSTQCAKGELTRKNGRNTNSSHADLRLRHVRHARLVLFSRFPPKMPLTSSASEPWLSALISAGR